MEKIYNNFAGMDLDTSPEKFNPNYYSTAYNVRIGSNVGVSVDTPSENKKGSLEGIKNIGAVLSSLFADDTAKIIALTRIRDYLVFILSTATTQGIYKILESELSTNTNPSPFFQWNKLEFTLDEGNTQILGRYETDKLIKVYISDGATYLKSINLASAAPTSIKQLEVFKPIEIVSSPSFTVVTGGSLKAGNICYGIQYYSLNGSATNYIPVGPIVPILNKDISDASILVGGALNETTDKAANITIPYISASRGLNYAKVVRIHYTILGELPTISVVYDGVISNTVDTVVMDGGQFISSVSAEEYALIMNPFKCKTLEQKNNILFAGNILQSEFDIDYDARMKRYNYGQSNVDIHTYEGNYNNYNDYVEYPDPENTYAWQKHIGEDFHDETFIYGGTGDNGKYYFETSTFPVFDQATIKPIYTHNVYHKVFQRGEVYGFALVGFDEYMRPCYAKFIDDIKIPNYFESCLTIRGTISPMHPYDGGTNKYYATSIYPVFEFLNLPNEIKYTCIVRTDRSGGDGKIADVGIMVPTWKDGSTNRFTPPINGDSAVSGLSQTSTSLPYYYEIVSPKILVNKSLPNFDFLTNHYSNYSDGGYIHTQWQRDQTTWEIYHTELHAAGNILNQWAYIPTLDKKYYPYNTNKDVVFQIGGETISTWTNAASKHGFKSSCALIQSDTIMYGALPTSGYQLPPVTMLYKTAYPYGGYTDSAIEQRSWIISSPITKVTNNTVTISTDKYGDTYSQISPYCRILWDVVRADWDGNLGHTSYISFESQVLLKGVAGKTFDNYFNAGTSVLTKPFRLLQETKGVWIDNSKDPTLNSFTQENDLYGYNSAYSCENKSKVFITKPSVYVPQTTFDCQVKNSDRKINGELIDSWTIFKPNNRIELDTSRGSLTGLVNLNNTLFFIQEAGGGTLAVDERELIPSSNVGNLYLGTGGVLSRFDYIFTNYGARKIDSVTNTNNFIYFYDSSAGKLCRMNTQSAEILSDIKNCKSYFSKVLYNNNFNTSKEYILGADNLRQEIYIKPLGSEDGIVYNELWNDFTSLTTIPFTKIFTTEDIMYFQIPNAATLTPFNGKGKFLYGLFPTSNPDLTNDSYDNLEHSLTKSVDFIISNQLPCRLDLVEWTSSSYTTLSNTDIEEKYQVYKEDILFKEFLDSNSNPNPRYFNKKRYNKIYNVNTRERCKGNYFKIKYIGNPDKLKKSNFTLNSFNTYVTPLTNR